MTKRPGAYSRRLARAYGICALSFLIFFVLLGLVEQVGVSARNIGYLLCFFALALFATIGLRARTFDPAEFYVAGRRVPPVFNGMAAAADWLGAACVLGLAAAVQADATMLAVVIGSTGGFVLLAVLIAPYLRKSGAYTVPDFLAARFGPLARGLAVVVLVCCSLPLLVVQVQIMAFVASRLVGMDVQVAAVLVVALILLCSLLGGMRAVTWTQVAQYLLLVFAAILPVALVWALRYGVPLPQAIGSGTFAGVETLRNALAGATETSQAGIPAAPDPTAVIALVLCLALGTAATPHLGMRFLTVRSIRDARTSAGWSLVFVALPLLVAPAYAALFSLAVDVTLIGAAVEELPDWIYAYGQAGLVSICGVQASATEVVRIACEAIGGTNGLRLEDIAIAPEAVVLAAPRLVGLPAVVTSLVATGALTAALGAATGLTLAIANSLSHDVYHKILDPDAPAGRRLLAGRLLLIGVTLVAAWLASKQSAGLMESFVWCSALAAGGFFPVLVLAIWWRRCTTAGAVSAMAAGLATVLLVLAQSAGGPAMWPLPDMPGGVATAASAAVLAALVGFLAAIVVSLLTRAPPLGTQDLINDLRTPAGGTVLKERPA